MSGKSPESVGRSPKGAGAEMSAEAEARALLIDIAGPLRLGENIKVALARVAHATGLGGRRVRGIWNGEVRSLRARELDAIRGAARRSQERADDVATLARDFEALAERVAALAARSDRQTSDRMRALALRVRHLAPGE